MTAQLDPVPAFSASYREARDKFLDAARAAGLATVVTPNDFTAHHDFTGALRVLPEGLANVSVDDLRRWHAEPRRV